MDHQTSVRNRKRNIENKNKEQYYFMKKNDEPLFYKQQPNTIPQKKSIKHQLNRSRKMSIFQIQFHIENVNHLKIN